MSAFWPYRLSTPTMRKFSSPNCALGSRMSREFGSSAEIRLSMLFFADCHCQAPPVIASASTAKSAASERPANMTRRRDLGFFGGVDGLGGRLAHALRRDALGACAPQRRQIGKLVGVGHRGDDLGVRVGQVRRQRRRLRRGPKLPGLPRRLRGGGGVAASGSGSRRGVPARRSAGADAGDLGDQVGDGDAVGVVAGRRRDASASRTRTSVALPRRGGSRWPRSSGKPLVGAVRGRTRAGGQEWRYRRHSCPYRPPTLWAACASCAWASLRCHRPVL